MAYIKNTWVDQDVERPKTYEVTNNQDGSITLTDSFGLVTELGTPVNETNMNHIEEGIDGCAIRKHNLTEVFNLYEWVLGGTGDDEGFYKSLVANNVGNAITDSTKWEKVEFGGEPSSFDGQITTINTAQWNILSNYAMNSGTTPYEVDLSNLLPNDGAEYMCLFTGRAEPYNYAGRTSILGIKNSNDTYFTWLCVSTAYDSNAKPPAYGAVWYKIPADRVLYVFRNNGVNYSGATIYLDMRAYRRIGTNL